MMKRFIKFGLGLFVLFVISVFSFSYGTNFGITNGVVVTNSTPQSLTCNGLCCIRSTSTANSVRNLLLLTYGNTSEYVFQGGNQNQNDLSCFYYSGDYSLTTTSSSSLSIMTYNIGSLIPSCPTCEVCEECPTCSLNSCILTVNQGNISNDYTCSGDCNFDVYLSNDVLYTGYNNPGGYPYIEVGSILSSSTGDLTGINWSILHINGVEHIGAGFIDITIPGEIDWDYIYTGNGDVFELDVKGYNVDSDYIEGIINTQTTKPNNIDFNNTITGLLPLFIPGLVIILFIYFIFRFLKKVF